MKYILVLLLNLLTGIANAQESCLIVNNDYDFSYTLNKNILHYQIVRKDKSSFSYFNLNQKFPIEMGLSIGNNVTNDKIPNLYISNKNIVKQNYHNFYSENNNWYSKSYLMIENGQIFYLDDSYFIKVNKIDNTIDIDSFVVYISDIIPKNKLQTNQKIKVKIKLLLKTDLSECLIFTTKPIVYSLSSWNLYWKKTNDTIKEINEYFELY